MGSGQVNPHNHTFAEPVYETKNNLVHYVDTKCTVCNYKKRSEEDHNFVNGICTKCSGWEPYKTAGAYIVVNESGIMPYSIRLQKSGKEVEPLLPKGTYVEVTDVHVNDAGNYWGKVTWIDNSKASKTMYIYMGSGQVNPHKHTYESSQYKPKYQYKNDDVHLEIRECSECKRVYKKECSHINTLEEGIYKCAQCGEQYPADKSKGNYVTQNDLTLYSDKNLTKVALTVSANSLIVIKSTAKKNSNGVYYGIVSKYGTDEADNRLYVRMNEIIPHNTCPDRIDGGYIVNDTSHVKIQKCTVIGCNKTFNIGKPESHDNYFVNGKCSLCQKKEVSHESGFYKADNNDVYIWNDYVRKTKIKIPKDSILFVSEISIEANNYWGKVTYYNGSTVMPNAKKYVQMSDLAPANISGQITGVDENNHYYEIEGKIVPEKHDMQNNICSVCGKKVNDVLSTMYIVNETIPAYKKGKTNTTYLKTTKKYQKGSVVIVGEIGSDITGYKYFGSILSCNGVKESGYYVLLSDLKYHSGHTSEGYIKKNNAYHTHYVNCDKCGKWEAEEKHSFNSSGICVFCGEKQSIIDSDFYKIQQNLNVYKALDEEKIVKTLQPGTFVYISGIELNQNGMYRGKVQIIENGVLKDAEGYISTDQENIVRHEHSYIQKTIKNKNECMHTVVLVCSDCSHIKEEDEAHANERICSKCNTEIVPNFKGDYLVKSVQADVIAKLNANKSLKAVRKGDYIRIDSVEIHNGLYYGKILMINNDKVDTDKTWYIRMRDLESHVHTYADYSVYKTNDVNHYTISTCQKCAFQNTEIIKHTFSGGKCIDSKCRHLTVNQTPGVYASSYDITVYNKPSIKSKEVTKKPTISAYIHIIVQEVKLADNYYWGKIGKGRWIYMDEVSPMDETTIKSRSYVYKNANLHTVKIVTNQTSGSYTEKHEYDTNGQCKKCDAVHVTAGRTYYTDKSDVRIYSDVREINGYPVYTGSYTIEKAGTRFVPSITNARKEDTIRMFELISDTATGETVTVTFCKGTINNKTAWIKYSDLTDHIHIGKGIYVYDDDEYHSFEEYNYAQNCVICGADLPQKRVLPEKLKHNKDDICVCGLKLIPETTGKYYAPYTGFHSYRSASLSSVSETVYEKGAVININKIVHEGGIIWGKTKPQGEYVMMKTLLTVKPEKEAESHSLTDEDIIEWCRNFSGMNPLPTYTYYSEEIQKIGSIDIIFMAINTRADSPVDQIYKWIKEAAGYTTASEYYKKQIISILCEAEESASYKAPSKETIKWLKIATKAAKNGSSFVIEGVGEHLKPNHLEAIKLLKEGSKTFNEMLSMEDDCLNALAYMEADFSNMLDIIDAVKEMQKYSIHDKDLQNAFDDVILIYENKWFGHFDTLFESIFSNAMKYTVEGKLEIIDQALFESICQNFATEELTEKTLEKYLSQTHTLYKFFDFAADMGMLISGMKARADAVMGFMSQITVMQTAMDAFDQAVRNVKMGYISDSVIANVRTQFELYKASKVELYTKMLEMECNNYTGSDEDEILIKSYLQYEINKLRSIELTKEIFDLDKIRNGVNPFDEFEGMTVDDYKTYVLK